MELVARTDTLHLDTYSISAGKVLWNFTHGGEKGAGTPPGRPASLFPWLGADSRG